MKATHDYVGKDDNELTFKEGDTIMVPAPELEGSKSMIKGACARAALRLISSVLLGDIANVRSVRVSVCLTESG